MAETSIANALSAQTCLAQSFSDFTEHLTASSGVGSNILFRRCTEIETGINGCNPRERFQEPGFATYVPP